MARAGAQVSALDLAPELVEIARLHLLESGLQVDYRLQSAEAIAAELPATFDAVTCMEMLEHVPDPPSVLRACASLLKPGGKLFVSTLNRTPLAFAAAIVGAEYLAGLLPKGTHDYQSFIRPAELAGWLRAAGLVLEDVSGLGYDPIRRKAWVGGGTGINYLACAVKA
jgi:2-polyprenyl-6-hydroxyphenyl methylase/3-demethylubiquinone-9 3-methyltransferase